MSTLTKRYKFTANQGGHAPGYLRDALLETLDWHYKQHWFERLAEDPNYICLWNDQKQAKWDRMSVIEKAHWLCGQLWNCTDALPDGQCMLEDFDLKSATYAALVRRLRPQIPAEDPKSIGPTNKPKIDPAFVYGTWEFEERRQREMQATVAALIAQERRAKEAKANTPKPDPASIQGTPEFEARQRETMRQTIALFATKADQSRHK